MTRCTARAVCFSKSSLCFFTGLPMVVVAVVAARAVSVVVVLAVTPAVGVWEDELVKTSISGGDWLPVVVDAGALLRLKSIHEKNKTESRRDSD